MRPAVDALAKHCRVISFSLADEPTSGASFDASAGVWSYVQQVADVLDATGVRTATICGVSYGGLIAAAFAARHPDKVSALVLSSAIPPSWKPDARVEFLMRARLVATRIAPRLMARRARLVATLDVERQLGRVKCPTLVVTGEPTLDRVVPVALTRDYHRIWPHASEAVLQRTGHLGLITRPDEFARLVASFADQNANRTSTWRSASGGMGAG